MAGRVSASSVRVSREESRADVMAGTEAVNAMSVRCDVPYVCVGGGLRMDIYY
jgi:hypothetical protein